MFPLYYGALKRNPLETVVGAAAGGVGWATFVYERVTIRYVASFRFDPRLGMGEPVNLDDEVPQPKEHPKPIKEDFSLYSGSTAEIVVVQWNDRKCRGQL